MNIKKEKSKRLDKDFVINSFSLSKDISNILKKVAYDHDISKTSIIEWLIRNKIDSFIEDIS